MRAVATIFACIKECSALFAMFTAEKTIYNVKFFYILISDKTTMLLNEMEDIFLAIL